MIRNKLNCNQNGIAKNKCMRECTCDFKSFSGVSNICISLRKQGSIGNTYKCVNKSVLDLLKASQPQKTIQPEVIAENMELKALQEKFEQLETQYNYQLEEKKQEIAKLNKDILSLQEENKSLVGQLQVAVENYSKKTKKNKQ